jgi:hypothetical protein
MTFFRLSLTSSVCFALCSNSSWISFQEENHVIMKAYHKNQASSFSNVTFKGIKE